MSKIRIMLSYPNIVVRVLWGVIGVVVGINWVVVYELYRIGILYNGLKLYFLFCRSVQYRWLRWERVVRYARQAGRTNHQLQDQVEWDHIRWHGTVHSDWRSKIHRQENHQSISNLLFMSFNHLSSLQSIDRCPNLAVIRRSTSPRGDGRTQAGSSCRVDGWSQLHSPVKWDPGSDPFDKLQLQG